MAFTFGPRRCTIPISGAKILKTGQTTSYASGDDGDIQAGRDTDFFTLASNNPFGNTNRFTDEFGGQTYTAGIVIDWSTYDGTVVLGWAQFAVIISISWNDAITAAQSATYGTFTTGWRLPNLNEHLSLVDYSSNKYIDYLPFGPQPLGTKRWISSTTFAGITTYYWSIRESGIPNTWDKTSGGDRYQPIREFTVAGNTLL